MQTRKDFQRDVRTYVRSDVFYGTYYYRFLFRLCADRDCAAVGDAYLIDIPRGARKVKMLTTERRMHADK